MVSRMLAATAVRTDPKDPLSGLEVGERPEPSPPDGWTTVRIRAASLNHHDLWSLQGVGLPDDKLPMILGCDGAGVDEDGNDVVVHAVIGDPDFRGDETLDPKRSLLSEVYDGTLAEQVAVPRRNLVPKPADLSFEEASCLPTAWLTAYRMLFTQGGAKPGQTVLVQGAGGGVATALVAIGKAAGLRMWVTSRDGAKRDRALEIGADQAFESGARLPERVDIVMETVGEPTWDHSLKSLAHGGTIVCSGATGGNKVLTDLRRIFFLQQRIVGSTMGTRDEMVRLLGLLAQTGLRPLIDSVMPLAEAESAFRRLADGEVFGKIVLTCGE
jgi:NADPH:quinone reductase-like Zn-dependent oxidoreductase